MLQSPPAWEAGIEIKACQQAIRGEAGRLPHGRRGLKSFGYAQLAHERLSPPAWEAGIEI